MQLQSLPNDPIFVSSQVSGSRSPTSARTGSSPIDAPKRFPSVFGLLFGFLFLPLGCTSELPTLDPKPPTPYRDIALTVAFSPNIRHPELFEQHMREWSARTGASVKTVGPEAPNPDVRILPPAELPTYAAAGNAVEVPGSLRGRDQKYQWDSLVDFQSEKLSRWNNAIVSLPLVGDGYVLVYRKESFVGIPPPATWEQFVETASKLHRQSGKPSLPPLPKRVEDLDREFYAVAASYDRMERNQTDQSRITLDEAEADRLLSFQYRLKTLEPRIHSPAFVRSLAILQKMQLHRMTGTTEDTAAAFRDGTASLGFLTLEELARLQAPDSSARGKFGIAAIPGSEQVFDVDGHEIHNKAEIINRIPYVGWGGWCGMVTTSCNHSEAAWDLLADFGNPDKTGTEIIAATHWGAGPFRLKQTDQRFRHLWLGYDFSPGETDRLLGILRQNMAAAVVNYRLRLRIPNQDAHMRILTEELRLGLVSPEGKPEAILNRVAGRWKQLWEGVPAERKRDWIRFGLGLSQ